MISDSPPPEINEISMRAGKKMSQEEVIDLKAKMISMALKDHDANFAKDAVNHSNRYCTNTIGEGRISFASLPCRFSLCNIQMKDEVKRMMQSLRADGLKFEVNDEIAKTTNQLPTDKPPTGLHKAIQAVRTSMVDGQHALHKGFVYSKVEEAKFTYFPLDTVEDYLNRILQYEDVALSLLGHTKAIVDLLKSPACTIVKQMAVNYDLIEVMNGKCWQISARKFIDCPYNEDDVGFISPRMYFSYDSASMPKPGYFKESVLNSFPQPIQYTRFLNKWYQLLLHERMPQKVRKLCTWGSKDSGKSTWIEPLRALVPVRFFGALTKENSFGTSMIDEDTQVTFIDEFLPGVNLSNDVAKQLFQGGMFTNTRKYQTGRLHANKSPYYIVCQREPDFGEDDAEVKRRLYILKTKALPNTTLGIDIWLQENAMHCFVWAGQVINTNHDLIEPEELFYEPGRLTLRNDCALNSVGAKDTHYERIGVGKRKRLAEAATITKPLFRTIARVNTVGPTGLQTPPTTASETDTIDMDIEIDTPPRPTRTIDPFSPASACCTPLPIHCSTPTPTISSPSSSSEIEESPKKTEYSAELKAAIQSTADSLIACDSQNEPIIDPRDVNGIMARDVFHLLQSNIAGNATSAHLLSHISKYQKFGTSKFPKIDAEFNAFCFIRGRFVGTFDPTIMFRYYKKDIVNAHVQRLRKLLHL